MHSLDSLALGWSLSLLLGFAYSIVKLNSLLRISWRDLINASSFLPSFFNLLYACVPAIFSEISLVCSNLFIYKLFSDWHVEPSVVAAWTIKLKLEELLAMIPIIALGMATSVLVGQSSGCGLLLRMKSIVLQVAGLSSLLMFGLAGIVFLFSGAIASLFSADSAGKDAVSSLLKCSVACWPLLALSTVCCAALEGCGVLYLPMILNIVFQVICRLIFCRIFRESHGLLCTLNIAQVAALLFLATFSVLSWQHYLRFRANKAVPPVAIPIQQMVCE